MQLYHALPLRTQANSLRDELKTLQDLALISISDGTADSKEAEGAAGMWWCAEHGVMHGPCGIEGQYVTVGGSASGRVCNQVVHLT